MLGRGGGWVVGWLGGGAVAARCWRRGVVVGVGGWLEGWAVAARCWRLALRPPARPFSSFFSSPPWPPPSHTPQTQGSACLGVWVGVTGVVWTYVCVGGGAGAGGGQGKTGQDNHDDGNGGVGNEVACGRWPFSSLLPTHSLCYTPAPARCSQQSRPARPCPRHTLRLPGVVCGGLGGGFAGTQEPLRADNDDGTGGGRRHCGDGQCPCRPSAVVGGGQPPPTTTTTHTWAAHVSHSCVGPMRG